MIILVIHEHCIPDGETIEHSGFKTYSQIAELGSGFDIIVGSHLHLGFEPQVQNNMLFINPWSFTKLARNYYAVNYKHKPQVNIVTINGDYIDWETIYSPCKPFEECFIEKELKQATQLDINIESFAKSLEEFQATNRIDFQGMLEVIRKRIEELMIL